jgi:opacity protein-like surface antigen
VKRCFLLIGGALLLTTLAAATDEPPRYEAFAGFQYVRANQFNQNAGLGTVIGGFDMYGGDGQFQYNFNKWISGVIDGGAVNKPNVAVPGLVITNPGGPLLPPGTPLSIGVQNTTAFTFGGPRIYWRHGRWAPFGEVLFGGAFRRVSTGVIALTSPTTPFVPVVSPATLFPGPNAVVSARLSASENAFAMRVGGGLDYKLGKYFSLRPVEVDYILTRFPSLSTGFRENQSSIAASAGIIFTFGAL